ncbi:MAG: DUF5916 domain-containing protein [Acidobacteriota bacterium]
MMFTTPRPRPSAGWYRSAHLRGLAVAALSLAMLAGALRLHADAPVEPEENAVPMTAEAPLVVPLTRDTITIDGVLDEAAWQHAARVLLTYETRATDNTPAPMRTEMYITYDTETVYVGWRAFDPEPDAIRARFGDRDRSFNDDYVGIALDTFNDGRRAFQFLANPLGLQMDLTANDLDGNEDEAWDALWVSFGRLTATGYEVEMAIPSRSLRFPSTDGPLTFGFDAFRNRPREQRYTYRSQRNDRNIECYVCEFSKMTGFEELSAGRNLEFVPTLVGTRTDARADLLADELTDGDEDGEAGLTVSWGITPGLNLGVTINPDFSQVEADNAQLDVNNQFALFFPETRPFFLEGADFFDTPINAVNTRSVADPDAGIKLTGKQGVHAIGVFAARDATTELLLPGSQGSDVTRLDGENDATVLRYRRDLGARSNAGILVTDRRGEDGYLNTVVGFDGVWRPRDTDRFSAQLLTSRTRYPRAVAEDFNQPSDSFDDLALRVDYRHSSRHWFGYARVEDVGEDFRADLGFLPRVDFRFYLAGLERIWWGEDYGDDTWWSRFEIGSDWDVTQDQDGLQLENEREIWTNVSLPVADLFVDLRYGSREVGFGGRTFQERFTNLFLRSTPSSTLGFEFFARRGNRIDFVNVQPADQLLFEFFGTVRFGRRVRVDFGHIYDQLDLSGTGIELFTANLSEMRLQLPLTRRFLIRLISQYVDVERNPAVFPDGFSTRTEDLFNQLLVSYKWNARTVVFVGYSDGYEANDRVDLTQRNRTVFLKLGYAWTL